jgi:hypoxanthine phosphoribosyltransferase
MFLQTWTPEMAEAESIIQVHDKTFRPLILRDEISAMVVSVASKINRDFAGEELTVIVILKGSFLFAADLVRHLTMPVVVEFARASSYGKGMTSSGTVTIEGLSADVEGRNILLIEDIVESGTTITELKKHLSLLHPKSLTVAALLSKPSVHNDAVSVDYIGREIGSEFVVGYGLDYAEQGRHLADIWVYDASPEA